MALGRGAGPGWVTRTIGPLVHTCCCGWPADGALWCACVTERASSARAAEPLGTHGTARSAAAAACSVPRLLQTLTCLERWNACETGVRARATDAVARAPSAYPLRRCLGLGLYCGRRGSARSLFCCRLGWRCQRRRAECVLVRPLMHVGRLGERLRSGCRRGCGCRRRPVAQLLPSLAPALPLDVVFRLAPGGRALPRVCKRRGVGSGRLGRRFGAHDRPHILQALRSGERVRVVSPQHALTSRKRSLEHLLRLGVLPLVREGRCHVEVETVT